MELGKQCEICGHANPDVIETHHKVPQRLGGSDHPDNLVSLCGSCHNAIERIYDDPFYEQLFDKTGYEIQEEDVEGKGTELPAHLTPDRGFPRNPVHVTVEDVGTKHIHEYADAGLFDWEELEDHDILKRMSVEEWVEENRKHHADEDGNVPEETEEHIDRWKDQTPKFSEYNGLDLIHCGYCNTAFLEWEQSDAAKHLQVEHRVEDPYLRESDNLSDWEKRKRVLRVKDEWNGDDSISLNTAGLDGGYNETEYLENPRKDARKRQNNGGVENEW